MSLRSISSMFFLFATMGIVTTFLSGRTIAVAAATGASNTQKIIPTTPTRMVMMAKEKRQKVALATSSNTAKRNILCYCSTTQKTPSTISLTTTTTSSSFYGNQMHILPTHPAPPTTSSTRYFTYRSTPKMMPEGPEVRTLVDQLQPAVGMRLLDIQFLSGRYVRNGKPKGFEEFGKTMTIYTEEEEEGGETQKQVVDIITEWNAKGKFLYFLLDSSINSQAKEEKDKDDDDYLRSVWITLGMTGKFVSESAQQQQQQQQSSSSSTNDNKKNGPRWVLSLLNTQTNTPFKIYYYDTRNFGTLRFSLSKLELEEKIKSLGCDILKVEETTEGVFLGLVRRQLSRRKSKKWNVCRFLMDQSNLSGIGNYILAEGLYKASIDPFANLDELSETQCRTLFTETQSIALNSYASQGLTRKQGGTYRTVDGSKGKFEFQLNCYGRDYCGLYGEKVIKEVNGPHGRTIWYTERQLFVPRDRRSIDDGTILTEDGNVPHIQQQQEEDIKIDEDISTSSTAARVLASGIQDAGWKSALSEYISTSTEFQNLAEFVKSERNNNSGTNIYPSEKDVFAALNLCPIEKVKVVIIGQDPYHGFGQGHGLAFSVRKGVKPPPSLVNIFKEAMVDVGIQQPKHGNLEYWAKQGVLLLNSVLTVREGKPNSHAKKGWEDFTDQIVEILNKRGDEADDGGSGLVFLLWGAPAARKASAVDETKHAVIRTSHPSPLGATKTDSPFLGSRCFSRANDALVGMGKEPIDWNVN